MKLTVLGSGTCIPNKRRGSSGYLLEIEQDLILFDCGNGTTWKLEEIGINYLEIDHIFITHFHPDHTSDLIPFLFATKNPFHAKRSKTLKIWGPMGLKNFFEKLFSVFNKWIKPDYLEIIEIQDNKINLSNYEISTFNTLHTENSVGYILSHESKKFIYSGDTGYFDELRKIVSDCDLLVIECSVPNKQKNDKHLSPRDIISIVKEAKPKQVLLTHLYPNTENEIDYEIKHGKIKNSNVIIAEDFLEIEF